VWQAHAGFIGAVAFAPDNGHVLSGSSDGDIRYWDLEGLKELRRFKGHNGNVSSVAITPDGRFAASAGRDGTVRLWELPLGQKK
jgi:WD40 repeat protein